MSKSKSTDTCIYFKAQTAQHKHEGCPMNTRHVQCPDCAYNAPTKTFADAIRATGASTASRVHDDTD